MVAVVPVAVVPVAVVVVEVVVAVVEVVVVPVVEAVVVVVVDADPAAGSTRHDIDFCRCRFVHRRLMCCL